MITIFIDNQPHQVRPDQNLLQACLTLGFDLPYFCWHPALHAVGACRQCAVKQFKDKHDTKGKIIMSCMTPVAEGMRISVNDPEARAFRKGIIEYLMLNHPHDCPVCDEGGECHLQDMTVMTGHSYRRTRFPKRTHRNQELGPFINHEMNRCIQCYRCVRYYRDAAGGRDLNVFGCHDHVFFGRHEDGMLESEFSGNLVEICPTGVFTDKTLKQHYTRKWDLQTAPSICVHCGLGCNTIAGERYGSLRRVLNRYHHDVNGYYLCDRGRFGYGFVNSEERIRLPLAKSPRSLSGRGQGEGLQPVDKGPVLDRIAEILSSSKGLIAIGSPRASIESNFALRRLAGPDNFYVGMADREHALVNLIIDILRKGPARAASLQEAGNADAVLVLGEDVTNTAPLLALSLRRAVRQREFQLAAKAKVPPWNDAGVRNTGQGQRSPLFIATPAATKLDDAATGTYRAAPDDIARLGYAVARELDPSAPEVPGLRAEIAALARDMAAALRKAERPLVVAGTTLFSEAVIRSANAVATALSRTGRAASLLFTVPECNSMGLCLMAGRNLGEAFTVMNDDLADTVIILENDLYRRADAVSVDAFLKKAKTVIALDHLMDPTVAQADIVLPSGTFAESTGTIVNNEGRAQRFYQVHVPADAVMAGWQWLDAIMNAAARRNSEDLPTLDALLEEIASVLPVFEPLRDAAPPSTYRITGQKIPRQALRFSGRTAMHTNIDVSEQKPPDDPDSPLAYSMEGTGAQPPSPLISRYWAPGWNSVQALNKFQQEIGGPLIGGEAGRLLLTSDASGALSSTSSVPGSFAARPDRWLLVPRYHLFGSEELSIRSQDTAELVPQPYLALGKQDAAALGLEAGGLAEVCLGDFRVGLAVIIAPDLPIGVAAYPFGPLFPFAVNGPAYCSITKRPSS
ncbi:MAG: NADH-quinone oxidoreductase subunit NuoG [Nitrospirota bacterium]